MVHRGNVDPQSQLAERRRRTVGGAGSDPSGANMEQVLPSVPSMVRHLLVPTDGSDLADGTIRRAGSFAREAGARITFGHAQESFSRAEEDGTVSVRALARAATPWVPPMTPTPHP